MTSLFLVIGKLETESNGAILPSAASIGMIHKSDQMNESEMMAAKRRKRRKMGHRVLGELTVPDAYLPLCFALSALFCGHCLLFRALSLRHFAQIKRCISGSSLFLMVRALSALNFNHSVPPW
jgi:hypothetical protein